MLKRYEQYLNFLQKKLDKFFNDQKPYMFCKAGCAKCCKNAEFPYSLLEVQYLLQGLFKLDDKTRNEIEEKILDLIEKRKNTEGKFLYDCPFLINDSCSVYEYRGLVCRAFGLLTKKEGERLKTPFCCFQGLNYSNIYDKETNQLSEKKMQELNITVDPIAYNVGYDFLSGELVEKTYNINFGYKKPLIEFFLPKEKEEKEEK